MKKLVVLLVALGLIAGCASSAYKRSLEELPDHEFSVNIPEGWWKPQSTNKYLITKDGAHLQYVRIQQRPLDRPFRHTKKMLRNRMLPLESARVIIDELASDRYIMNFKVAENSPAVIGGHSGFKIVFTYENNKGAQFKTLYYGFINGDSFFNLRYNAATRHYYDKDITDFKQILNSFKLDRG
jgi:hypothetical protein